MRVKSLFSTLLRHELRNKKSSAWLMGDQARDENSHETENRIPWGCVQTG
nr:MAG TPA: hypothetical protein [Caudoviricetes sp.]